MLELATLLLELVMLRHKNSDRGPVIPPEPEIQLVRQLSKEKGAANTAHLRAAGRLASTHPPVCATLFVDVRAPVRATTHAK